MNATHVGTVVPQVPQYNALADGYDPVRVSRLLRTNRVRTVGWSIRAIVVATMVVQVMSS